LSGASDAEMEGTGLQREPADEAFLRPRLERTRESLGADVFAARTGGGRAAVHVSHPRSPVDEGRVDDHGSAVYLPAEDELVRESSGRVLLVEDLEGPPASPERAANGIRRRKRLEFLVR